MHYQHTNTSLRKNLHVSKVHCGSAFEPGASGLLYYCTPHVCVSDIIGGLAVLCGGITTKKLKSWYLPRWHKKIWWLYTRGRCYTFHVYTVIIFLAQLRLHTRRVYSCTVPVFRKIWYHTHLDLCTCCVCFAQNMMTMRQQFSRLRYVNAHGQGLVLLCCREATFSNYQIVHGLPPPPFRNSLDLNAVA